MGKLVELEHFMLCSSDLLVSKRRAFMLAFKPLGGITSQKLDCCWLDFHEHHIAKLEEFVAFSHNVYPSHPLFEGTFNYVELHYIGEEN